MSAGTTAGTQNQRRPGGGTYELLSGRFPSFPEALKHPTVRGTFPSPGLSHSLGDTGYNWWLEATELARHQEIESNGARMRGRTYFLEVCLALGRYMTYWEHLRYTAIV